MSTGIEISSIEEIDLILERELAEEMQLVINLDKDFVIRENKYLIDFSSNRKYKIFKFKDKVVYDASRLTLNSNPKYKNYYFSFCKETNQKGNFVILVEDGFTRLHNVRDENKSIEALDWLINNFEFN